MKTLILVLLFGFTTSTSDTFRFTQCECPQLSFSSDQKNNFEEAFQVSGDAQLFSCPGEGPFPEESGVILTLGGANGGLITTDVNPELFQESSGERNAWHAGIRFSFFPVLGAQFKVMTITESDEELYIVSASVVTIGGLLHITFSVNGVDLEIRLNDLEEISFQILVGEMFGASINSGVNLFDAAFFCVSLNLTPFECSFADGVMSRLSVVNIQMFESDSTSVSTTLKVSMVHFDSDSFEVINQPSNTAFLNQIAILSKDIFNQQILEPISLPFIDESVQLNTFRNIELDEDISVFLKGGNIATSLLSFSVTSSALNGDLDTTDLPRIRYTPDFDFIGNDSFEFSYRFTSTFSCENTGTAKMLVSPNPPSARNLQESVFVGLTHEFSDVVATDLDGKDGLLNGRFLMLNTIPGLISESCDRTAPITEASVVNGVTTFCYTPDESLVSDTLATLEFLVIDEDNLIDLGTIEFNIKASIFLPSLNPVEIGLEDSVLSFSLGDGNYAQRPQEALNDLIIGVRITKLPSSDHGVLVDSDDNLIDLISNAIFTEEDTIKFIPSANTFNAFEGLPSGVSGDEIGNCDNRVAVNELGSFCEISFEYQAFLKGVELIPQKAFLLINAVDDEGPVIRFLDEPAGSIVINRMSSEHNRVSGAIGGISVTSDAGANEFQVKMRIIGRGGSLFLLTLPDNLQGLLVLNAVNNETEISDCSQDLCDSVDIVATPSQLEEVANELNIQIGPDFEAPKLNMEVVSLSQQFGVGSHITIEIVISINDEPRYFDSLLNLISTVVGALALIGSCIAYYKSRCTSEEPVYIPYRVGEGLFATVEERQNEISKLKRENIELTAMINQISQWA